MQSPENELNFVVFLVLEIEPEPFEPVNRMNYAGRLIRYRMHRHVYAAHMTAK